MTVLCQIVVNEYIPEVGNSGQSVMNRTQCLCALRIDLAEKSDIFFNRNLFVFKIQYKLQFLFQMKPLCKLYLQIFTNAEDVHTYIFQVLHPSS